MTVLKAALILTAAIYLIKLIMFTVDLLLIHIKSKSRPVSLVTQEDIIEYSKDNSRNFFNEIIPSVKPILEFWENESDEEFGFLIGDDLRDRIGNSRKVLKSHGIRRKIRVYARWAVKNEKGQYVRKWDDGGQLWQACDICIYALEEYYKKSDNSFLSSYCYPSGSTATIIKSRRLSDFDKQDANSKDKWGRKKKEKNYYDGKRLTVCPSCGAALPRDDKDPICSFCGATIFADYYDWQIEALEFIPKEASFKGIAGRLVKLITPEKIGNGVKYRKKRKGKFPIVRFSENSFRADVYKELYKEADTTDLVDMQLGAIRIKNIKNTENETFVKIRVPVYSTIVYDDNKILRKKEIVKACFVRDRYPVKFDSKNAVISAERSCPNCGSEFAMDKNGCCIHCGTFLMKNNTHWKRCRNTEV